MEQLRVTVDASALNRTVVHVAGELDAVTVGELVGCVRSIEPSSTTVLLDLSQLTFLDSMGIGALIGLHRELDAGFRVLELRNLQAQPRRVLDMTAVLEVLHLG